MFSLTGAPRSRASRLATGLSLNLSRCAVVKVRDQPSPENDTDFRALALTAFLCAVPPGSGARALRTSFFERSSLHQYGTRSSRLPRRAPSLSRIDLGSEPRRFRRASLLRKEVIQPHLPIRLPCYDFTPVIGFALGGWPLAVTSPTLGAPNSHGVTGGVYKARERIHRGMLIRDY